MAQLRMAVLVFDKDTGKFHLYSQEELAKVPSRILDLSDLSNVDVLDSVERIAEYLWERQKQETERMYRCGVEDGLSRARSRPGDGDMGG